MVDEERRQAVQKRIRPVVQKARVTFTEDNARHVARQVKAAAQSERARTVAMTLGGLAASAVILQQKANPSSPSLRLLAAAAHSAGLDKAARHADEKPLVDDVTSPAVQADSAAEPDGAASSKAAWSPPSPAAAGHVYPSAPVLLVLNFHGSGVLYRHPELPDLQVECTILVSREAAVSFDWKSGGIRRSHMLAGDLWPHWAQAECSGVILPVELRPVEDGNVEFRWLAPSAEQLAHRRLPTSSVDAAEAAKTMKAALGMLGRTSR
jgi:hypothetical protein